MWNSAGWKKTVKIGIIILSVMITTAFLVWVFSPYNYAEQNADIRNMSSSVSHWFGTDKFGRDIFTRVWRGAGISIQIGLGSVLINGIIGIITGCISGFFGRKTDMILMRTADVIVSIPSMIYIILISLVFGANTLSILAGICISGWVETARIVRGEVLRLKGADYIIAARMSGVPGSVIIYKYLLPVGFGPIVISLTYLVPRAIFAESFLSFIGIGLSPPISSLGTMIRDALNQAQVYPMQLVYPVLVLCFLIISVNMIGIGMEQKIRNRK